MIKEYSILDAFRALDDLEEEVNQPKKDSSKKLTEGKTFDLGNNQQMEEAKTFLEDSEKKEDTEIQVIDVDADSLDHIKNNEEYIGQYILQCNACKTLRYISEDKLQASENDPAIYNVEDECPHCHALNSGYALIGQVGRVEKEEPTFDNDEKSEDEFTFEKEEETVEEAPAENDEAEFEPVEEPEENPDEVPEDDTADMESTFGDEINSDETAEDDTEEKDEEEDEEAKLAAQLGAALEADEEEEKKKKAKKESFSREQAIKFLEEKGINCTEGLVATYAKMLLEEDVDESELNEDFYYQETLDSIAWRVDEYRKGLQEHETWINEDFEPKSPEEELAKTIVSANGLKVDNMNKSGTPEYFILKEITEGPVSEDTYINYIHGLDEEIRKAFASMTGFDMEKAEFELGRKPAEESLDEAKKEEEELPADPEAVKTEVHDVINNLVKDEIEAINGYEEAKAVIADTHIEHKDEIIDTIDHVEDEEKEHIDELIDAAGEIPFDKDDEDHKEEKEEEPVEETPVETPEEVIPEVKPEMVEEPVEEAVKPSDFEKIAKEAEELTIEEEVETPAEAEPVNEDVDIHIEGNEVHISDNSGEEVAIIPVEPEAEEAPTEGEPAPEEIPAEEAPVEEEPATEEEPVEEGLEIDEKAITEAINSKLKETGNEDAVFETLGGSFDDNSMLIEGNIISGDLKVPTKFRFESLEEANSYKVTNTLSDEEYIINL